MCGRPVFVLVVGAAVCCMLNKEVYFRDAFASNKTIRT